MKGPVLILGATSAIARKTAFAFAARGCSLYLAARHEEELARISKDIFIRYGVSVRHAGFEIDDIDGHKSFFTSVVNETGNLSGVLFAIGELGNHDLATRDFKEAGKIIHRNLTGAISILSLCADHLAQSGQGFIIGIGSVAGDRGRQSNFLYGAAKGGFSLYLQGLRNHLHPKGVRVITIKPGFVDTAMTYGMKGLFLVASPDYVGNHIVKALDKSADILYIPWFWRYIMLIIRSIPEPLFKRLKL